MLKLGKYIFEEELGNGSLIFEGENPVFHKLCDTFTEFLDFVVTEKTGQGKDSPESYESPYMRKF